MNLTLLVYCFFFTPIVADPPAESVAIVDLRECFQHAPTSDSDRAALQKSIEETDAEARKLVEALEESEYYADLNNSTDLQKTKARILKLEFEAFRHREQDRLRRAEQDMYKEWHKQVDIAVKTVAQRDGFTIVLYIGKDENPEIAETEPLLMLTRTHVGFAPILFGTKVAKEVFLWSAC